MKLGAGKAKIEIPQELFPLEQFGAVHDDLYVRTMIFQGERSFAIVSFEATSLRPYAVEYFHNRASKLTGIPAEQIWICVTHTFSAPHLRSEEALARDAEVARKNEVLFQNMTNAMEDALKEALAGMAEVRMACGLTACFVNVNRDIYTDAGWWLGADEKGISDKTVPFVRFDTLAGEPKAILYNYDVQSSVMDHSTCSEGYALVTGDLSGRASSFLEEQFQGSLVALFLPGAAGDQAPVFKAKSSVTGRGGVMLETDLGDAGFAFVKALGDKLGSCVLQAVEKAAAAENAGKTAFAMQRKTCPGQKIAASIKDIHPTHSYDFVGEEDRSVEISVFTVGDLAIAGVGPELSGATAMSIRKASPYPVTMVVTMVNGGDKYMPDETAYERITYEAMNSKFARGSAEIVQREITDCLHEMKEGQLAE